MPLALCFWAICPRASLMSFLTLAISNAVGFLRGVKSLGLADGEEGRGGRCFTEINVIRGVIFAGR